MAGWACLQRHEALAHAIEDLRCKADARVGEEVLRELGDAGGEGSLLLTVSLDWEIVDDLIVVDAGGHSAAERV